MEYWFILQNIQLSFVHQKYKTKNQFEYQVNHIKNNWFSNWKMEAQKA